MSLGLVRCLILGDQREFNSLLKDDTLDINCMIEYPDLCCGPIREYSILSLAVSLNQDWAVRELLKKGALIDGPEAEINAPIVRAKNPEMIRLISSYGADLNGYKGSHSVSPLFVNLGVACCFDFLLELGADIDGPYVFGNSLLDFAYGIRDQELMKFLIKRGAKDRRMEISTFVDSYESFATADEYE